MSLRKTIADLAVNFTADGLDNVRSGVSNAVSEIKAKLSSIGDTIIHAPMELFSKATSTAKGLVVGLVDETKKIGKLAIDAPIKIFTGGVDLAKRGVEKLVDSVKDVASEFGKLVGIGGLLSGGGILDGVVQSVKDANDKIQASDYAAQALGIPIEQYSQLADIADHAGTSIDTMQTQMTKLNTSIGLAVSGDAKGKQYADLFKSIGINITDAAGRAKPMLDILQQLSTKLQGLDASSKSAILTQLFGRGDQGAIGAFLKGIAASPDLAGPDIGKLGADANAAGLAEAYGGHSIEGGKEAPETPDIATRAGAILTQHDIDIENSYTSAVADTHTALDGLKYAINRAMGPAVVTLIEGAANSIIKYRDVIVQYLVNAFAHLLEIGVKVQAFFASPIGKEWIHGLSIAIQGVFVVFGALIDIAGKAAQALDRLVQSKTGKSISDWVGSVGVEQVRRAVDWVIDALTLAAHIAGDLWHVLLGQNNLVDAGDRLAIWAEKLRATVANVAGEIIGWSMATGKAIIDWLGGAWSVVGHIYKEFVDGWNGQKIDVGDSAWHNAAATIHDLVDWFIQLFSNIYKIFVLNQDGDKNFAWLKDIKTWLQDVGTVLGKFYNAVKAVNDFMRRDFGGFDLTQGLLWISLGRLVLKITGLGKLLGDIVSKFNVIGNAWNGVKAAGGWVADTLKSGASKLFSGADELGADAAEEAGYGIRGVGAGIGAVTAGLAVAGAPGEIGDMLAGAPTSMDDYDKQTRDADEERAFLQAQLAKFGIHVGLNATPPPSAAAFTAATAPTTGIGDSMKPLTPFSNPVAVKMKWPTAPDGINAVVEKSDLDNAVQAQRLAIGG